MEKRRKPGGFRLRNMLLLITYGIVLYVLLSHIQPVWGAVRWALDIISPLLMGVAFAFLFHLPMEFFQYKVFAAWENGKSAVLRRLWRGISMLCAYLVVFLILGGVAALIIPQILSSLRVLAGNFGYYLDSFQFWLDGLFSTLSVNPAVTGTLDKIWDQIMQALQQVLTSIVGGAVNFTLGFTTGVVDILFALMLSGFMLYNREKLFSQFTRLSNVLLGDAVTSRISEIARLIDHVFGRFIMGQILEAFILGALCFTGMQIFKMQYALLISCVIGVTALIPILGAWIGTIPCALILLVIEPMQAIWFVAFIVILQQLEGDFIYPRVVGNAVGLPSLWVLSSIILGGALMGVWGMLLATPTAAVCYRLIGAWLNKKEKRKAAVLPAGRE